MLECPLGEWESKLESLQQRNQIQDTPNFREELYKLMRLNADALLQNTGKLPVEYQTDLRLGSGQYASVFSNSGMKPNNKQFAIAQFAVAYSLTNRR